MAFTRSFEGFAPPRRYDGLPFTAANIREAANVGGVYATIDTIALSPLDSDPTAPTARNFTTALATLAEGWYIIQWVDAAGSTFDSDPINYAASQSGGAGAVTVADVEAFIADIGLEDVDEARIVEARDLATARLEDACRCSFSPRETTETVEAVNGWALLANPLVSEVLTVDGEEVNTGPYPSGRIPLAGGEHEVTYRYGHEELPLPIRRAILLLTRHMLSVDPTDFDERATSKTTELAAWSLVTPGMRGAIFPIPEVNQIVSDYAFAGDIV
jgi:hypothetical protein